MSTVFFPTENYLKQAGFESVAHVPVLFGPGHVYQRHYNRYLRERALLEWSPAGLTGDAALSRGRQPRYLSRGALRQSAYVLSNFDEWLGWTGLDWKTLDYKAHILDGYRSDMLAGRWSARSEPLSMATADGRSSEALRFLEWARDTGLRGPLHVPRGTRRVRADTHRSAYGHRPLMLQTRAGAVRMSPFELRMPTAHEIARWLRDVEVRHGLVKALMCRFVLDTGLRREEIVEFRCADLGRPEDWRVVGENVRVHVVHGTKGYAADVGDEERGPDRWINVPITLAEELHRYINGKRLKARLGHKRAYGTWPCDRLFLSEYDCRPVSATNFYRTWTNSALPFKGWSPHPGRHYWACRTLLQRMETERALRTSGPADDWIYEVGRSVIETVIQPQLGHVSAKTTEGYLRWAMTTYSVTDHYVDYHRFLEAEDA